MKMTKDEEIIDEKITKSINENTHRLAIDFVKSLHGNLTFSQCQNIVYMTFKLNSYARAYYYIIGYKPEIKSESDKKLIMDKNKVYKERATIVVISSYEKGEYFFSNDHCQDHDLGETFVPCSHTLPSRCELRDGIENGIIDTIEKLIICFYSDMKEIEPPKL